MSGRGFLFPDILLADHLGYLGKENVRDRIFDPGHFCLFIIRDPGGRKISGIGF